jgi:conjugal transfer pilus assembly protein TraU
MRRYLPGRIPVSKLVAIIVCSACIIAGPSVLLAAKKSNCEGNFINPITDVHWRGVFPIKIGGVTISAESEDGKATLSSMSKGVGQLKSLMEKGMEQAKDQEPKDQPTCECQYGQYKRRGITFSFFEPAAMIEVVKTPFCFPFIGKGYDNPFNGSLDGDVRHQGQIAYGKRGTGKMQVHYVTFLPIRILNIFVDLACVESMTSSLDIGSITEVDSFHQYDILSFLYAPESLLVANMIAQLTCTIDAVAANAGYPLFFLFHCNGSWGSNYPLSGSTENDCNVEMAAHLAARQLFKMGRFGLTMDWASYICGPVPMPITMKHQFKFQIARPVVGKQCFPIGRSSMIWGGGKNPPKKDSDQLLFMMFQKRRCCAF